MAHKGKVYKLWFRRDAAYNVNASPLKYPEALYIAFKSLIFSSRYAVSQIDQVLGVNLNKTFTRVWTSEVYGGFFDNVYWIFEVLGDPQEPIDRVRFSIWHDAIIDTPLYDATYRFFFPNVQWDEWVILNRETLHFLSPDVTVSGGNLRVTLRAADYTRYNP
jgi:hypothetical protein